MSGNQMILLGGTPQAVPVDPYFYSVTSLLHGDGTNGGQNNTFLDSSTNNFTITRNGNTTQGSFSPFSQTGWSNYFDGTGDYLTAPNNSATDLGSGDFTIEAWVNTQSSTAYQGIIQKYGSPGAANGYSFRFNSTGSKIELAVFDGSNPSGVTITGTSTINNAAWHHVAAVRTGTTLSLFVDGIREVTTTNSFNITSTSAVYIAQHYNGAFVYTGYLSNVRVIKGAGPYNAASSTLTVPTTPLTAITNTSLLTCQANRFLDASTNAFAITRAGDVSVQPFSPFNPTTAYSTSAVGGSGYFDGSGDYISAPSNAAFDLGSGNFTMEAWIYPTSYGAAYKIIFARYTSGGASNQPFFLSLETNGTVRAGINGTYTLQTTATAPLNAWTHVAWTRSGNDFAIWLNGVSSATLNQSVTLNNPSIQVDVGAFGLLSSNYFTGYIANARIVKGTAVYTAAFTPPTTPLTAITNTSLLLNFTNGAIYDNAAVADYETVGNAQISTSVKKYGTGSMYFDGNGDGLRVRTTDQFLFNTGDFTVECWVNFSSTGQNQQIVGDTNHSTGNGTWGLFYNSSLGRLRFIILNNQLIINEAWTPSTGIWYHIAVTRSGGSAVKLFINGTQIGSTATSTANINNTYGSGNTYVGRQSNDTTDFAWMYGYIDDVRITKGYARYTYNFTPPTAEFPNIGGTVTLTADPYYDYTTLLLPGNGTNGAQNNTFLDSSTNAFSITRNGNTTQGTFSPFSQTGWGNYFDGSGDGISFGSNVNTNPASSDITVEAWIYPLAYNSYGPIFSNDVNGGFHFGKIASGFGVRHYGTGDVVFTATTPALNQWTHVAVSRSGNSWYLFYNGTQVATATASNSFTQGTACVGGNASTAAEAWNGYLSNVRFVKGTALYTSNFTPSTTPLTAVSNTQLLTCQSNRFKDNSSNAYAATVFGTPSIQAFSPFNPTAAWSAATNGGSGYFDGSGDLLSVSSANQIFPSGTQNFSVEFYTYFVSAPSLYPIFLESKEATNGFHIVYINDGGVNQNKLGIGVYGVGLITGAAFNTYFRQWVHVVATRNGNDFRLFFNGNLVAYASNTQSFATVGTQTIGAQASGLYPTNAYITDIRTCLGAIPTDYQTSSTTTGTQVFTPPSAPVTTTSQGASSVAFLANFTNAGIYDATSKNDLETVGNAQISTTQSKFGGSSMYFDGTGDYLYKPSDAITAISGDFTIEAWVYRNTTTTHPIVDVGDYSLSTGILFYINNTNALAVFTNNASLISGGTIAATTWTHVAVVRYGSTVSLYVNGIKVGTPASNTASFSGRLQVGADFYTSSVTNYLNGYIDDLRITKGIARYTSNFTPPTTAFLTL